jgi:hypothetical protein
MAYFFLPSLYFITINKTTEKLIIRILCVEFTIQMLILYANTKLNIFLPCLKLDSFNLFSMIEQFGV